MYVHSPIHCALQQTESTTAVCCSMKPSSPKLQVIETFSECISIDH